jgi:hypothetical protein
VTEACKHEHIDTARACGHHAVEVQVAHLLRQLAGGGQQA